MRCNQKHQVSQEFILLRQEKGRGEPQMSVQLFYVVLLVQDRCDLTVAEGAKPQQTSQFRVGNVL